MKIGLYKKLEKKERKRSATQVYVADCLTSMHAFSNPLIFLLSSPPLLLYFSALSA
jgi:hypothetical protein